jgi:hypothetical protein
MHLVLGSEIGGLFFGKQLSSALPHHFAASRWVLAPASKFDLLGVLPRGKGLMVLLDGHLSPAFGCLALLPCLTHVSTPISPKSPQAWQLGREPARSIVIVFVFQEGNPGLGS